MPGGFVGVDVFFVISGYLISGIIIKQAKKGKFSIIDFYERRVKRIYPALILVMIFALIVAHKAYSYKQLKKVAGTMVASSIFSANLEIMVFKQDYFDASEK
jgi:peptidoglycan/LPS O-acetylase OafA/YrhL